jgi:hypothetical protein
MQTTTPDSKRMQRNDIMLTNTCSKLHWRNNPSLLPAQHFCSSPKIHQTLHAQNASHTPAEHTPATTSCNNRKPLLQHAGILSTHLAVAGKAAAARSASSAAPAHHSIIILIITQETLPCAAPLSPKPCCQPTTKTASCPSCSRTLCLLLLLLLLHAAKLWQHISKQHAIRALVSLP